MAALTGIDTDRLKEEKERGISIDLGFAHLALNSEVRLGLVDVPGHERFIKNMLAGVGGIDIVLFVIAADESIKPQTREHFDICRLLGIRKGVVVLTKSDLVDQDILDLARLEAEEFVQGSFLEGAPVVAVSAKTGAGLDELRSRLAEMAAGISEKDSARWLRLPIDRVFTMKGFGTVVTGTLLSGRIGTEQDVELQPEGRRLRVRGVQVHGEPVRVALAGQRTAVNLIGIEPAEIARGMALTEPSRLRAVTRIDCAFDLLPGARPLRHRAPIHFHSGTAELTAEVRILSRRAAIEPGSRDYARIVFRHPVLVLPGDRFIARMFSPVVTIGGGIVLDISPPRRGGVERLQTLESGSAAERVGLLVLESEYGLNMADLVARTGLLEREIVDAARAAGLVVVEQPQPWLVNGGWLAEQVESVREALKLFHRQKPLMAGMPREELRARVLGDGPPFLLDAVLARAKDVVSEGDLLRMSSHRVAFREDETEASRRIEAAFEQAGLAVPPLAEVLAKSGVEAARARTLLQMLLRDRKLVKVAEGLLFHASAIDHLHATIAAHRGARFSVPEFKDWTGISRKYAIPLLEFLDRQKVTAREGDMRVVL